MVIRDPVCGMPVDPEKTEFKIEVRGKVYYFCNEDDMHQKYNPINAIIFKLLKCFSRKMITTSVFAGY